MLKNYVVPKVTEFVKFKVFFTLFGHLNGNETIIDIICEKVINIFIIMLVFSLNSTLFYFIFFILSSVPLKKFNNFIVVLLL
jgi:hypothetical protein